MHIKVIKGLASLANHLDSIGYTNEASYLDDILKKADDGMGERPLEGLSPEELQEQGVLRNPGPPEGQPMPAAPGPRLGNYTQRVQELNQDAIDAEASAFSAARLLDVALEGGFLTAKGPKRIVRRLLEHVAVNFEDKYKDSEVDVNYNLRRDNPSIMGALKVRKDWHIEWTFSDLNLESAYKRKYGE